MKNVAGAGKRHKVQTGTAIMGVRGTLFLTHIDPNTGEENLSVFDGAVDHEKITTQNSQDVLVTPGYGLTFGNNQAQSDVEVVHYRSLVNRIDATVSGEINLDTVEVAEVRLEEVKKALQQLEANKTKTEAQRALELAKRAEQSSVIAAGFVKGSIDSNKKQTIDSHLSRKQASLQYLNEVSNYLRYETSQVSDQVTEIAQEVGLTAQEIKTIVDSFTIENDEIVEVNPLSEVTPVSQRPSQPSSSSGGGGGGGTSPTNRNNEGNEVRYFANTNLANWYSESTSPDSMKINYNLIAHYEITESYYEENDDHDLDLRYASLYLGGNSFNFSFNKRVNSTIKLEKIVKENGQSMELSHIPTIVPNEMNNFVYMYFSDEEVKQLIELGKGEYTLYFTMDGKQFEFDDVHLHIFNDIEADIKNISEHEATITFKLDGENYLEKYGSYRKELYSTSKRINDLPDLQCDANLLCEITISGLEPAMDYSYSLELDYGNYEVRIDGFFTTDIPIVLNDQDDRLAKIYNEVTQYLVRMDADLLDLYEKVFLNKEAMEKLPNMSLSNLNEFPLNPADFNPSDVYSNHENANNIAYFKYAQFILLII